MKKYPRKYETISRYLFRLKLPGGWIFTDCDCEHNKNLQSSVFIPDPNHEWNLENPNTTKP